MQSKASKYCAINGWPTKKMPVCKVVLCFWFAVIVQTRCLLWFKYRLVLFEKVHFSVNYIFYCFLHFKAANGYITLIIRPRLTCLVAIISDYWSKRLLELYIGRWLLWTSFQLWVINNVSPSCSYHLLYGHFILSPWRSQILHVKFFISNWQRGCLIYAL